MKKTILLVVVMLALGAGAANADPITYNFTVRLSQFNDSSNFFGGALAVGSDLAGSFTYDSAAVDVNPNPAAGLYLHSGPQYGGFVTGGGITFSVSSPTDNFSTVVVNDFPPSGRDALEVQFFRVATAPMDFCTAKGGCANAFMTVYLQATSNVWNSDALPLVLPSLGVFDQERRFMLTLTGQNAQALAVGEVTSLTPSSAVPEPASLLLLGTGLAGLVRVARRRRQ